MATDVQLDIKDQLSTAKWGPYMSLLHSKAIKQNVYGDIQDFVYFTEMARILNDGHHAQEIPNHGPKIPSPGMCTFFQPI